MKNDTDGGNPMHYPPIPNEKEFDAREKAWKKYAPVSDLLHDTAERMSFRLRSLRDPLRDEEDDADLVKHILGDLIAIKTDAYGRVPVQYLPVLNAIYEYFLKEIMWYSKVDEMNHPLQYEHNLSCKENAPPKEDTQ